MLINKDSAVLVLCSTVHCECRMMEMAVKGTCIGYNSLDNMITFKQKTILRNVTYKDLQT